LHDCTVYARFHAIYDTCLACGHRGVEAAHLLRGKDREDVLEGLIPLCSLCHGAFDKRTTHIGDFGRKVTPQLVDAKVAAFLRSEAGDDHCAYLIRRRGPFGAEHYVLNLEGARF
jgi:hypothetical protein